MARPGTFIDARGSFTDAAVHRHVHKDTVHCRVRKAEGLLGHPPDRPAHIRRYRPRCPRRPVPRVTY
ncbi:helix-turn-helix domain-containing protein [Streptomyces gibsoniae]|uniref:Helix-turn-helix domain-containing protein n=1 Tax=Streptomyces gibsoniae TaxID=3075529 RepID=A0ABU2U7N5_9ACTN|nr:helix-turn-helix domain-containing protein [Streptomyces sp. DSM 41699]MDT0469002.1 helix-turn-helix domain-containing protein [Streptomyces sp. DSM 41699]